MKNLIIKKNLISYKKLNFRGGNNVDYDFINFSFLRELYRIIYHGEVIIPAAERDQGNFDYMIDILKKNTSHKKIPTTKNLRMIL